MEEQFKGAHYVTIPQNINLNDWLTEEDVKNILFLNDEQAEQQQRMEAGLKRNYKYVVVTNDKGKRVLRAQPLKSKDK